MGYYDKFLMHEEGSDNKRDKGMNSTSNEKGTDGKKNNTSEYNHQYYMKNKEKWGVKTEYSENDHDFDEKNYSEENRLGDSDFYGFQNKDGSWTILLEDEKMSLPKGITREQLNEYISQLQKNIEDQAEKDGNWNAKKASDAVQKGIDEIVKKHGGSGEQEFDVDAAARDVISGKYKNGAERKAALGDDYEMVQKRVNEMLKGQKSSSSSSSSKSEEKKTSSGGSSSTSSGPSWRGKNKVSTPKRATNKVTNKPGSRKRSTSSSRTSMTHSEVYGSMNDWREYECLYHHGIKGQHWGVRRFQNSDGSLTSVGRSRYGEKSDKIEKNLRKSTSWENRAINAKTGLGRSISSGMAADRRMKADKLASKAEGDYKALQINKNRSRNFGAAAEAHSNIAKGLKDRADNTSSDKKRERILNNAVKHLATAENMETGAKSFKAIAETPAVHKGGKAIKEMINRADNQYTAAGRKHGIKDVAIEAIGDAAISTAYNLATNAAASASGGEGGGKPTAILGATSYARDVKYRHDNSAQKRWDKMANGR